jgi:hypothetical protein
MAHRKVPAAALTALALSLLFFVTGCDFDGGYAGGSSSLAAQTSSLDPDTIYTASVGGSVGDGPIVNARLRVFSTSGDLLMTTSSDNTADYKLTIRTQGRSYPLTIVADQGMDIVTGREPDFELVTTIMKPGNGQTANLNPYSTLIVKAAQKAGGINETNIATATEQVVSRYGFGLDPALMPDPLFTPMTEYNVHLIVKASETMGEMIRRTRDALIAAGTYVHGNDVVEALAADFVDGWIDGKGAQGHDRRIAAVANVASAAVMVEAMANRLHVYDVDSTMYMDNAIRQVRPNAPASSNTRNVSIPSEALDQTLRSLRAAKVVKNDPRITEIHEAVAKAEPGTTEFDALSSGGMQTMSRQAPNPLNDAILATAMLYDGTKHDDANSAARTGPTPSSGGESSDKTTYDDSSNTGSGDPTSSTDPVYPATPIVGPVYYVAPHGNDSRTKAQAADPNTPWRTIQHAINNAVAGDNIVVKDGIYTNTTTDLVWINKWTKGTAQNPIRVLSQNRWGAVLDGNYRNRMIFSIDRDVEHIIIEGFEIKRAYYSGIYSNPSTVTTHNITIRGNWIHNIGNDRTLDCERGASAGISGVTSARRTRYWTIDGNRINTIGRLPGACPEHDYKHDHGLYVQGHGHVVMNNIIFDNKAGWDIKADHTIARNDESGPDYEFPPGERAGVYVNNTLASINPNRIGQINLFRNSGPKPAHVLIMNNVFWNSKTTAVRMGSGGYPWPGLEILNNITTADHIAWNERDSFDPTSEIITNGGTVQENVTNTTNRGIRGTSLGMADPARHDFRLTGTATLLIDQATTTHRRAGLSHVHAPSRDHLGIPRPQGSGRDRGAHEWAQ